MGTAYSFSESKTEFFAGLNPSKYQENHQLPSRTLEHLKAGAGSTFPVIFIQGQQKEAWQGTMSSPEFRCFGEFEALEQRALAGCEMWMVHYHDKGCNNWTGSGTKDMQHSICKSRIVFVISFCRRKRPPVNDPNTIGNWNPVC